MPRAKVSGDKPERIPQPRTPAQEAATEAARQKALAAKQDRREGKEETTAKSEAENLASILAALPPGEPSAQEQNFAKLLAREQVHSDQLSEWLAANRSRSQAVGRKLESVLRSTKVMADLQTALIQASDRRINAGRGLVGGKVARPPNDEARAKALARILVSMGAVQPVCPACGHKLAVAQHALNPEEPHPAQGGQR